MSCARARRTACGAGTQTRLDARASLSYARMAVSYPKTPIPPAKADLPARVLHEAPRDRSCATAFRAMSERVRAHAEARAGRGRENGKGLALERSAKRRCLQEALQGFLRAPLPLAFFSVSLTCFGCVPGGGAVLGRAVCSRCLFGRVPACADELFAEAIGDRLPFGEAGRKLPSPRAHASLGDLDCRGAAFSLVGSKAVRTKRSWRHRPYETSRLALPSAALRQGRASATDGVSSLIGLRAGSRTGVAPSSAYAVRARKETPF